MGITVLPPGRQRLRAQLRPGRHGHPLRDGRHPQRRCERRRRDRRRAPGEGQLRRLLRLPAQGRRRGLQQEGHRVADQVRGVRLARAPAQGPAARARLGDRRRDEHEEGRVDGPVRPVRLDGRLRRRRRRRARRDLRREGPPRGVGLQAPARDRAGDARPLCLRASAARPGAGAGGQGGHVDRGHRRRHGGRGRAGHGRRHPREREPPGEQERRALGVGADRGPGRRDRGAVLPARLPGGRRGRGRGRDRAGQGAGSTGATTACR